MTQPSADDFFSGGGGKSVSWKGKDVGATVSGTITMVHPPQQSTDPVDGSPQFVKKTGKPRMQVRIELATDERDPSDSDDDGSRNLYVGGWMTGAVGDALRKAGATGAPQVGGRLSVTLSDREAPDNPALNPTNKFTAVYVPPTKAATDGFFGGAPATPPAAPAAPVPTPSISGTGYLPERPEAISEAAWAAMDEPTRANVAKTMAGVPPF